MAEDLDGVCLEKVEAMDSSSFRQRLNIARSNREYTDVSLRVAGSIRVFEAHQVVLAAASGILNTEDKMEIRGVSEDDLEDILTYIYVGSAQVPRQRLHSFMKAAQRLGVHDLKDLEWEPEENALVVVKVEPPEEEMSDYSMMGWQRVKDEFLENNVFAAEQKETAKFVEAPFNDKVQLKEKSFSCTWCGKAFQFSSLLKMHERSHTGEKPFSCYTCGKTYRHKSHLKAHQKIHTGEKPFACNFCEKKYIHKGHWKSHERTHTGRKPFSCSFCGKTFRLKTMVQDHERIHTGEKPFSCNVCGTSFRIRRNCKRHEKTHTGEKPFSCLICKKAFKVKASFKKHQESHV